MKILVPIKRVASLDDEFELRSDGRDVDQDFCEYDLNEFDEYSLEAAVQIKERFADAGVEVVALTVDTEEGDDVLRKALAKGADRAVRAWDDGLVEADQVAIARVIAKVAEREQPELILCGAQSADHGHAQTGIALAGLLKRSHAAVVSGLEYEPGAKVAAIDRELEGGLVEKLQIETPAVLTIQLGINKPRYASLRSIKQANAKTIEVLEAAEIGLPPELIGQGGSLSRVRKMFIPERGRSVMIEGTPAEQASRLLEIVREVQG